MTSILKSINITDSSRYRLSCLLFPPGDSPRPQVSPEELSARDDSLDTFSMQLESPKLRMEAPVSTKINLSDSIECLEIGNHKGYPNLKSISQYIQQNSNSNCELRSNVQASSSHSRYEPPPLQRSSRTYFQSNPALHQLNNSIHNAQCSSTSNLDKTKDVYFNDDFQHSCSTSNLEKLNSKKFETPQLTRHRNTEYLDYTGSYENLDRVRVPKRKVNLGKNRGLNRSSECLSRINEHSHMHPALNTHSRLSRRNIHSDRVRSFEGLNSLSCEAQPLLSKDEHKIIKIPNNTVFREELVHNKQCCIKHAKNKTSVPTPLPIIHSTPNSKSQPKLSWSPSGSLKRTQNSALVIFEAPTLKNAESTSSNHSVNPSKSKDRTSEKSQAEESTDTPAGEPVAKKKRMRCKVSH